MTDTHETAEHVDERALTPQEEPAAHLQERLRALHDAAAVKISDAVPANTRRAYAADRADWAAFCAQWGLDPLPVQEEMLALYVTELLEHGSAAVPTHKRKPLAASTVERRLSAVATWAQEEGHAPNQRASRKVLEGHRRAHPTRPRRAAAALEEDLRAMVRAAQSHELADGRPALRRRARDTVLLLVSWRLMLRRSEAAGLRLGDIQWHERGMRVAVRRPKTTVEEVWKPVPYALDPELCAVRAVRAWTGILAEAGHTAAATPLLVRVLVNDALPVHPKPLSPPALSTVVSTMAERAGLSGKALGPAEDASAPVYTGHSLRRGSITAAARRGAARDTIRRLSGHAPGSHVLESYIEQGHEWDEDPLAGL
ncbi:tyrosine-type recombinase/integrase [Nocardiopsis sp. NPDC006198]|uniref:tyrosine-type recombinase/integrase n=1 Tax=Nocardiopsis sp. NPDC006198 TaxID=3154472 RepID=UPI0033AF443D